MSLLHFDFDPHKSAQAAAYLLRLGGGQLSKGHLVKMLFAADRDQLATVGLPITGATPIAMKYGPILSELLDLLNKGSENPNWANNISVAEPGTHIVRLLEPAKTDHLTKREIATLEKAFASLQGMSFTQLSEFCHKQFREWSDPGDGALLITYEAMLKAAGRDEGFIEAIAEQQESEKAIRNCVA